MQPKPELMHLIQEVHVWFDTYQKLWLITAFDAEDNQVFDSSFAHLKDDAVVFAKQDFPNHKIVVFTRAGGVHYDVTR